LDVVVVPANDSDDSDDDPSRTRFLGRFIFPSVNGTCTGPVTDTFDLPLDTCIGPFGAPRPWGNLTLVTSASDQEDGNDEKNDESEHGSTEDTGVTQAA
jgi:hypothetical protein